MSTPATDTTIDEPKAARIYGVVLTGNKEDETLAVDMKATEKRRAELSE